MSVLLAASWRLRSVSVASAPMLAVSLAQRLERLLVTDSARVTQCSCSSKGVCAGAMARWPRVQRRDEARGSPNGRRHIPDEQNILSKPTPGRLPYH
eukprot:1013602-Prymnesium_polylepis.1